VIVFGSLQVDSLLLDQPIERIRIVQADPAGAETTLEPSVGSMFFTEPLPVGPRWTIVSLLVGDEELPAHIEFCPDGPGLLFLGSLAVPADASRSTEIQRLSTPSERTLLQDLLDAWRGTSWEEVILARIHQMQSQRPAAESR